MTAAVGWIELPRVLLRWSHEPALRRNAVLSKLLGALAVIVAVGAAALLLTPLAVEFLFMGRRPVVTVGDVAISTSTYARVKDFRRFEIIRELNSLASYRKSAQSGNADDLALVESRISELRTALISIEYQTPEEMIDAELLSRKAEAEGVAVTSEELRAEIESVLAAPPLPAHSNGAKAPESHPSPVAVPAQQTEDRVAEMLAKLGLERRLFDQIMRGRILDRRFAEAAMADVKGEQEQVHVKQMVTAGAEAAASILKRFDSGETWDGIAIEASMLPAEIRDDEDLGFVPRGILEKPLEEAAFAQEAGKIAGPVAMRDGQHLLLVVEKAASRELSQANRDRLRKQAADRFRSDLRGAAKVEYSLDSSKIQWSRRHGLRNVGELDPSLVGGARLP